MKKLIAFLFGIILIIMTLGMLFLASAIYDSAQKSTINTYFFQTNLWSAFRPGIPETQSQIGETAMREMLITKYVNEYFYVIPDPENIANRMTPRSTLAWISTPTVFKNWLNTTAEEIQKLAAKRMMRTVKIDGEIYKPMDSDYWIVPYALYTWENANDMNATPKITHGTLRLGVQYTMGSLRESFDVGKVLTNSYNRFKIGYDDPIRTIRFGIWYLENEEHD